MSSIRSITSNITPASVRGFPSLTLASLRSFDQTPFNTVKNVSSAVLASVKQAPTSVRFPSLTLPSLLNLNQSPSNSVSSATIQSLSPVAARAPQDFGTSVVAETQPAGLPEDLKNGLVLGNYKTGALGGKYLLAALSGNPVAAATPRHPHVSEIVEFFRLQNASVQTKDVSKESGIIASMHKLGMSSIVSSRTSEVKNLQRRLAGAFVFGPAHSKSRTPLTDVLKVFNQSVKQYPFCFDPKERLVRLQLGKDLRCFAQITQKLKELDGDGISTQFPTLFESLQKYRIDSSKLGVSLADLKKIRKEYEELLIQPISTLKEEHYREIISMLDKGIAQPQLLKLSIEKTREMFLPKIWEDQLYRDGMALGELKKVHAEMLSLLEILSMSQTKPLSEIRKEFLARNFLHLLKGHPLFKDQAEKLSETLAASAAEGRLTLKSLEEGVFAGVNSREKRSALLSDLNKKVDEVDNLLALMDILMKKDPQWFMLAASQNDVASYKPLIQRMESSIQKSQDLLNSVTGGVLTQKQIGKLEKFGSFHKSVNATLSDLLGNLASDYWTHRNAAVQQQIDEVSKSSKLSELEDLQHWKGTVVEPSKTFSAEVRNALQNGALTSELLAKQNEFMPHFLRVKKTLGNDLGAPTGVRGFFSQLFHKLK